MKRKLLLQLTVQTGFRDARLMDYTGPSLVAFDKNHRVGIRIADIPSWQHSQLETHEFLRGFQLKYTDALVYLLEDSKPIPPHVELPECSFKHLAQLADFLKETN